MRPAREGRENGVPGETIDARHVASMRPAREGRENVDVRVLGDALPDASMRPAREGRENSPTVSTGRPPRRRFNEARP